MSRKRVPINSTKFCILVFGYLLFGVVLFGMNIGMYVEPVVMPDIEVVIPTSYFTNSRSPFQSGIETCDIIMEQNPNLQCVVRIDDIKCIPNEEGGCTVKISRERM